MMLLRDIQLGSVYDAISVDVLSVDLDDGEPLPINEALCLLDKAMPNAKYSSYMDALQKEGFYFAESVLDFKANTFYFVDKVRIPIGSVPAFLCCIEKVVSDCKHHYLCNRGAY